MSQISDVARFRPAVLMGRLSEIRLWNESHSTGMIKSTVLTSRVSRLRFAPVTEFVLSSHEDGGTKPRRADVPRHWRCRFERLLLHAPHILYYIILLTLFTNYINSYLFKKKKEKICIYKYIYEARGATTSQSAIACGAERRLGEVSSRRPNGMTERIPSLGRT